MWTAPPSGKRTQSGGESAAFASHDELSLRSPLPKQLVPQLADQDLYLASESTFCRLQRRHGLRTKRRMISRTEISRATNLHRAAGPNQVWSWDITWLATTVRGMYLHLYLVHGVWSRMAGANRCVVYRQERLG